QERRIRFLIPPFFLLFALLFAVYVDPGYSVKTLLRHLDSAAGEELVNKVILLVFGSGFTIVIVGFLIGTITLLLLKVLFYSIYSDSNHEVRVSAATITAINTRLGVAASNALSLYPVATFDHAIIPEGVHRWLVRRWNSFNIAANSVVALLGSMIIVAVSDISFTIWWTVSIGVAMFVMFLVGRLSYFQTMHMIEFQSLTNIE
ncbi:MAG: hypothetical protein IH948_10305, partial [Bacteroidetes bacterium]|nr:hypothetical protein [Bacteroidota bacterium]